MISAIVLVVSLAGVSTAQATSSSSKPTGLVVTASTSAGAIPPAAVGPGQAITLKVGLKPTGATFSKATTLKLTPSLDSGAAPSGSLSSQTVVMPAKVTSKTFTVSYSSADTGVIVTASMATQTHPAVASGSTRPFDVRAKPTGLQARASTDNSGIEGAVPDVLVSVGELFDLDLTLQPAGAVFTKATTVTLTSSLTSGASPGGSLDPVSVVMPAGVTSKRFEVSYSTADNGVIVTASVTSPMIAGSTLPFDVQKDLVTFDSDDPRLQTGLGIGDAECTAATTEPLCGTVVLANGLASPQGALSLGECTADLGCRSGSQVVQFVADLGDNYTRRDPAVLIIRCDVALCPGKKAGPIYNAVYDALTYKVALSFEATGPLNLTSQPCLLPGVARDLRGNDYCTDLYQSHRDTNGDLLLYLLFTHDMRGSTR